LIIYNSLYRKIKNGQLVVMDAPVDIDTPDVLWETQRAKAMAASLASFGFNAWLWPPVTMSQGGSANNADGYGKQYDLNIGQWAGHSTRWGTAFMMLAANAEFHKNGMMVLSDTVIHQYDGGNSQHYIEIGSNGKNDPTLFPKFPLCFVPNVNVDNVFDSEGNYSFGDMVSYQNSVPSGYMETNVIEACKWRKRRLAEDGGRLDDTKGENVFVSEKLINSVGGFWFGECFTGNPTELEQWVKESGGKNTLDFTTHWALQGVCDYGASLRSLTNGFYAVDPTHSVMFVDTADTDQNNNESIKFNKLWAYAFILTIPARAALIYAGDYERYGLSPYINNLAWISSTFAIGNMAWPYLDDTFAVWSRDGNGGQFGWSGGLLCGINADPINSRSEWVKTPFAPNTHIQDYTGHGPDLWTNADGWAYLTIGPNVDGTAQNYVCYAVAGVERKIPIKPLPHNPEGSFMDYSDCNFQKQG
jgi:hypothetical protein